MVSVPKVSVIMPIYNAEFFLEEAIISILNQTLKNFELLLLDDWSQDRSISIMKERAAKDSRIVLIKNNKNMGITETLNKGISIAKWKYIARMDADDISLSERLEKQYLFLEKNIDIFLLGTSAENITEDWKKISNYIPPLSHKKIAQKLEYINCIYHPTIMFKNDKNIKYRKKLRYCEDYDLYLRLLTKKRRFANLSEVLLKYRIVAQSESRKKAAKQALFTRKAQEFYHRRKEKKEEWYESFDPEEILSIDLVKTKDSFILEKQIRACFKCDDYIWARALCWRYFKEYGYFNTMLIFYIFSFLEKNIINIIRRVIR